MPTEKEISQIVELWNLGKSYGDIANQLNGKRSTVQGWIEGLIKKGKIEPRTNGVCTNTQKAANASRNYNRERRLALNNLWFEKIEKFLIEAKDSKTIRELAVPYGIASDKRDLLEPIVPEPVRTKLDDLIERLDIACDVSISPKAGGGLQELPQDPSDADVRVGEKRQDGDPTVLQPESG